MLKSRDARQDGGSSMIVDGMLMNPVKTRRSVVAIAVLALCGLVPVVASAQSESEKKQQAREHYEKATRLYDVGKYGEAIAEYEQVYLLVGDAAQLFNIGQAYRLWDRPEDAIRAYKNFLRQRPEAANRADVERKISELEKLVDERKRGGVQPATEPSTPPPPAAYPPPSAPPMGYPPAPGAAPVEGKEVAEPGPAGVDVTQPAAPEPARSGRGWLVYTLFGVSGACLVTAGIAGAVGASKAKKLRDASNNREVFDPAVEQNGKTANGVAAIAVVAALASGGTAAYLLWRQRKAAGTQVSVVPVAAPSFAGASAFWVF
jgi:tetratricopeptide (TPR) repeat protein